jgi:hypothetical protein
MSKHAVNRLIEFIVLGSFCMSCPWEHSLISLLVWYAEYPRVRAFALAPGVVRTRLAIEAGVDVSLNTAALPAATTLYLTSGRADWLSGRSVSYFTHA